MNKTVLVGCAGTGTAFAAVSALRRTWKHDVKIVCVDINPPHLVTASLLADAFDIVRPVSDQLYPVELVRIISKYKVTVYLPLMPEEIVIAASLKASLQTHQDLRILTPCEEFAVKVCDKWKIAQLLQGAGLPTPRTYLGSAPSLASQKLIAKPRFGCGSKGVRITQGGGQHEGDGNIFQEVCSGPEVTVDAFNDPATGFTWTVCRERLETKSGVSTKCRLYRDTELNELAASLARVAGLVGSFCFQVMRGDRGWMIIDVNPRPGAGTSMCLSTGNDFFSATFALAFGERYERHFNDFSAECFVTRQYADFRS
jgi:predicted ATP-grasp superfamily ATP-dependent carboligase